MDEALADLQRRFPGWEIWYVPLAIGGATWCARPQGETKPVLNAHRAEYLAEYLSQIEAEGMVAIVRRRQT